VKEKEELSIICIKVVVHGKGDESIERRYIMKSRGPITMLWGKRRRRYTRKTDYHI